MTEMLAGAGVRSQVDTRLRTLSSLKAKAPSPKSDPPPHPPSFFHLLPQALRMPTPPRQHLLLRFLLLPKWDARVEEKADSDVTS